MHRQLPLPHDMVSPRLHQAAEWFDAYRQVCPTAAQMVKPLNGHSVGATRWVAAVLEAGGQQRKDALPSLGSRSKHRYGHS